MTAKSKTLKMTLGQDGRAASLTTPQKAGIYRRAMEEMWDHLEREHVRSQRSDPDATYMIEGLVGIYQKRIAVESVSSGISDRRMRITGSIGALLICIGLPIPPRVPQASPPLQALRVAEYAPSSTWITATRQFLRANSFHGGIGGVDARHVALAAIAAPSVDMVGAGPATYNAGHLVPTTACRQG